MLGINFPILTLRGKSLKEKQLRWARNATAHGNFYIYKGLATICVAADIIANGRKQWLRNVTQLLSRDASSDESIRGERREGDLVERRDTRFAVYASTKVQRSSSRGIDAIFRGATHKVGKTAMTLVFRG